MRATLCVITLCITALLFSGCPAVPQAPSPKREPTWTPYPALRSVGNLGPVVTDIESHLRAGHPYRSADRVNWVHEGTQGIAGQLRDAYRRPGFYVLNNRAVLLREPPATLAAVAAVVPPTLQGKGYNLYLIQSQQRKLYSDGRLVGVVAEQGSYVFDEWVAYANGSEARRRLGVRERGETVASMLEFIPYALCVPLASNSRDPQMREFIRWHITRCLRLGTSETLSRLRTAPDADKLRRFTRAYLGDTWTREVLGF